MDVDMFLDGYIRWEVESPHCSIILHEMFLYAAQQGQKEAEWMICWGCWHSHPKLDLQADVSAVQLVGPQTSKEEFRDLYYQVYKLRRLPESPLWGLEWMEKLAAQIVSSLKDQPGAESGQITMRFGGAWSSRCPASQEQNPQEGEEGHLCQERPHWGEGSPLEGPSYHGHLGGEDREAEPVCHPRLAGCPCQLLESWLPKKKILGTKQEMPQGLAGGEPCPLLQVHPSPVGSRILGGWRGWTTSPGFPSGATARVRNRGQPFPPRAGWQLRGRQQKQVLPRTPGRRVWKMGDLARTGTQYAWLVAGASQDPWCGWPPGASPEGVGLLWASLAD